MQKQMATDKELAEQVEQERLKARDELMRAREVGGLTGALDRLPDQCCRLLDRRSDRLALQYPCTLALS